MKTVKQQTHIIMDYTRECENLYRHCSCTILDTSMYAQNNAGGAVEPSHGFVRCPIAGRRTRHAHIGKCSQTDDLRFVGSMDREAQVQAVVDAFGYCAPYGEPGGFADKLCVCRACPHRKWPHCNADQSHSATQKSNREPRPHLRNFQGGWTPYKGVQKHSPRWMSSLLVFARVCLFPGRT